MAVMWGPQEGKMELENPIERLNKFVEDVKERVVSLAERVGLNSDQLETLAKFSRKHVPDVVRAVVAGSLIGSAVSSVLPKQQESEAQEQGISYSAAPSATHAFAYEGSFLPPSSSALIVLIS
jgi:predicted RNase H-related nuclease YkuK (DUF458 family)